MRAFLCPGSQEYFRACTEEDHTRSLWISRLSAACALADAWLPWRSEQAWVKVFPGKYVHPSEFELVQYSTVQYVCDRVEIYTQYSMNSYMYYCRNSYFLNKAYELISTCTREEVST